MAYRSTSIASGSGVASLDPGFPSGYQSSDILIAEFTGIIGGAARPIVPPSGWTSILTQTAVVTSGYVAAWWALGTVSGTSFATTASTMNGALRIHAFSGRNTTTPITASAGSNTDDGFTNMNAPSVTAATGDDILAMWVNDQGTTAFGAAPTGMTDANAQSAGGCYTAASYKENVASGATGTWLRDSGAGSEYQSRVFATIAIAQSSGGGAALMGQACL